MIKKWKEGEEEVSYWQSISDIMSSLLLILLLVLMLLVLYVVLVPENENIDMEEGDTYNEFTDGAYGNDMHESEYHSEGPYLSYWSQNENDSDNPNTVVAVGGGDGDGRGDGQGDYEFEEFGQGDFKGVERAAVYVKVVDAETRRNIQEEGITFTLFDGEGKQVALDSHYPEYLTYTEYTTTTEGVFFLPEKVWLGDYTLHEVSEPSGYDASENVAFSVEESREWDEPYIIEVALYPSRNTIRVQNQDTKTGAGAAGGIYDVIAAEDIVTADGTLRYTIGQTAAQIYCDDTGYGESPEVFLGNYYLRQNSPPEYYASILETKDVPVLKKVQGIKSLLNLMLCERTTAIFSVVDELYYSEKIKGAELRVTSGYGTDGRQYTADENGQIILDELTKNTTYSVTQISTIEGYRFTNDIHTFTVSLDGRIDGEAIMEQDITNRTLRASFGVRDLLMRNLVSDYNETLYNPHGEIIKNWNSSGMVQIISGLTMGEHKLVVNGGGQREQVISIIDTAEIQRFETNVWTNASLAAIVGGGLVLLGGGAVILTIILRKRKLKKRG